MKKKIKRITMDLTAPRSLLAIFVVFSESMKRRKNRSMVRFGSAPVRTPIVLTIISKVSNVFSCPYFDMSVK